MFPLLPEVDCKESLLRRGGSFTLTGAGAGEVGERRVGACGGGALIFGEAEVPVPFGGAVEEGGANDEDEEEACSVDASSNRGGGRFGIGGGEEAVTVADGHCCEDASGSICLTSTAMTSGIGIADCGKLSTAGFEATAVSAADSMVSRGEASDETCCVASKTAASLLLEVLPLSVVKPVALPGPDGGA